MEVMDDSFQLSSSVRSTSLSHPAPLPKEDKLSSDAKNFNRWKNAIEVMCLSMGGFNILKGLEPRPVRPVGQYVATPPPITPIPLQRDLLGDVDPPSTRRPFDRKPLPDVFINPTKEEIQLWEAKDLDFKCRAAMVYLIICTNLHHDVLEEIHQPDLALTPSLIWKTLCKRYGKMNNADQFTTVREVLDLRCGDADDLQIHFNKFNKLRRRLLGLLEPETRAGIEKMLSFSLLSQLPSSFNQFVTTTFTTNSSPPLSSPNQPSISNSSNATLSLPTQSFVQAWEAAEEDSRKNNPSVLTGRFPEKEKEWNKKKEKGKAVEGGTSSTSLLSASTSQPALTSHARMATTSPTPSPAQDYLAVRDFCWMAGPHRHKKESPSADASIDTSAPKSSMFELIPDSGCTKCLSPHKELFSSFNDTVTASDITIADGRTLKVEKQGTLHS
ncbi:hypothetical protein P7C70_g4940, partial [Phenoliferia sp. Uapishka_3]